MFKLFWAVQIWYVFPQWVRCQWADRKPLTFSYVTMHTSKPSMKTNRCWNSATNKPRRWERNWTQQSKKSVSLYLFSGSCIFVCVMITCTAILCNNVAGEWGCQSVESFWFYTCSVSIYFMCDDVTTAQCCNYVYCILCNSVVWEWGCQSVESFWFYTCSVSIYFMCDNVTTALCYYYVYCILCNNVVWEWGSQSMESFFDSTCI